MDGGEAGLLAPRLARRGGREQLRWCSFLSCYQQPRPWTRQSRSPYGFLGSRRQCVAQHESARAARRWIGVGRESVAGASQRAVDKNGSRIWLVTSFLLPAPLLGELAPLLGSRLPFWGATLKSRGGRNFRVARAVPDLLAGRSRRIREFTNVPKSSSDARR